MATGVDADAVEQLNRPVAAEGLEDLFEIVHSDFAVVQQRADVVFFELCLHEMEEPGAMVMHGLELAPDVVVIDHDRQSEWVWHACETEKVKLSWSTRLPVWAIRQSSELGDLWAWPALLFRCHTG